jgi:3-mercaptopyruvate sulfurtransferase SseA
MELSNIYIVYKLFILKMNESAWKSDAKNLLKAELQRKGIGYEDLAAKLKAIGVEENHNSINTKLNRGSFSFVFALQCMKAIGIKELRID